LGVSSTWKPKGQWLGLWDGESESRREMKRLRALNMVNGVYLWCLTAVKESGKVECSL
jgi:hypothetical protein